MSKEVSSCETLMKYKLGGRKNLDLVRIPPPAKNYDNNNDDDDDLYIYVSHQVRQDVHIQI